MKGAISGSGFTPAGPPPKRPRTHPLGNWHRFLVGLGALGLVLLAASPAPGLIAKASTNLTGAEIDQCTNGAVGPPIVLEPCQGSNISSAGPASITPVPNPNPFSVGSTGPYKNWVNGDSQGQKSHWRENQFIPYRVLLGGVPAGSHTLVFHYSPERSGLHAIDYLGSYDQTETPSTTPGEFNANNNNPCADLVAVSANQNTCDPNNPTATLPIANANLGNCSTAVDANGNCTSTGGQGNTSICGAPGTFSAQGAATAQIAGRIKVLAGDPGTTITSFSYPRQNVSSGTGSCDTTVSVTISIPHAIDSSHALVIAWGGHISSEADWGFGNTSSFINGSPYHMALDTLDGASTGSQDRALATSALFFIPSIATQVLTGGTGNPCTGGAPLAGTVPVGTSVCDSATLTSASPMAGGTVTYSLFNNGSSPSSCAGTATSTQTVTVTNALVPNSATLHLAAGNYAYQAQYSGDSPANGATDFPATSPCEPFTIITVQAGVTTQVKDAATGNAWSGNETTGASAFDSATVTNQVTGIPASGTVTYDLFSNGTTGPSSCSSGQITSLNSKTWPYQVTLTSTGTVPDSQTTGALAAGYYAFQAVYSGDSTYLGATSACEPFHVGPVQAGVSTTVKDAATGNTWDGTETTGASAFDSATVTNQVSGFAASGTVTYHFFSNGTTGPSSCSSGEVSSLNSKTWPYQVTLNNDGTVPNSQTTGALAAGYYAFDAVYSGDHNYLGQTSSCELFSVGPVQAGVTTTVKDAATGNAWSGSETTGASAFDSATVTNQVSGFAASGTVTYHFFSNGTTGPSSCSSGEVSSLNSKTWPYQVTLNADGTVPNSQTTGALAAGYYAFDAVYSGDHNYLGKTSACEPFSVGPVQAGVTTTVKDAATGNAWSGSETTGASAFDSATVTNQVSGFPASGTVTYHFFSNGTTGPSSCSSGQVSSLNSKTWPYQVTLNANGTAPDSQTTGALAAGFYAFDAVYSGDSNYLGATSLCEPFSVGTPLAGVTTTVKDAANGNDWSGSETTGASAYDTATVTNQAAGFPASGTVTYVLFSNGTTGPSSCSAGQVSSLNSKTWPYQVTLNNDGTVPNSQTTGALAAGFYAFEAIYSGDSNYQGSTSSCEPFSVGPVQSGVTTTVKDAATGNAWSGSETTGASALDSATVTNQVSGFPASGTVTYHFFSNGTTGPSSCSSGEVSSLNSKTWPYQVTLNANGTVPDSQTTGALAAGFYAFDAVYSGDHNYLGQTGSCEPFQVAKVQAGVTTTVKDAATGNAWSGSETTGASAFDSATVTNQVSGFAASGTVTYHFFSNGTTGPSSCSSGEVSSLNSKTWPYQVTLNADGTVPDSQATGALAAGFYAFNAVYSGDSNYLGKTSACEPFSVGPVQAGVTTTVKDAATGNAWSGSETTGASAFDSATVTNQVTGFPASGTVTYHFFSNGATGPSSCLSGEVTTLNSKTWPYQVTLNANGTVPDSQTTGALAAGFYAFQAVYSGDSNYLGATGGCEPFHVGPAPTTVTTAIINNATGADVTGTTVPSGTVVYDTAVVHGQVTGFPASGTVTYNFFGSGADGNCSGAPTSSQVVTLNSDGTVPHSNTQTLTSGLYSYLAVYSGDSNYQAANGPCEEVGVGVPALTPGFWKNHLSISANLILANEPFYIGDFLLCNSTTPAFHPPCSKNIIESDVTAIFGNMSCSNSSAQNAIGCLAGQLLAARLNVANGAPTSIDATIAIAQQFLGINGVIVSVTYNGVTANGVLYTGPTASFTLTADQRTIAVALADALSAFNSSGV